MAKRGRAFTFHGAYASKADAVAKERAVGGFAQPRTIRGRRRWVVMTANPGRAAIPGEVLEIRYRRSGRQPGHYKHPFKPGVRMVANADGSVTLRGRRNIHADDREPGFWQRYGHGRERRRNPAMARGGFKLDGMTLALLGGAAFLIFKGGLTGSMFARPAAADSATGAEPILYWFNDQTFEVVERWGTTPPGPGFRPASSYEVNVYGVGVGGGM